MILIHMYAQKFLLVLNILNKFVPIAGSNYVNICSLEGKRSWITTKESNYSARENLNFRKNSCHDVLMEEGEITYIMHCCNIVFTVCKPTVGYLEFVEMIMYR